MDDYLDSSYGEWPYNDRGNGKMGLDQIAPQPVNQSMPVQRAKQGLSSISVPQTPNFNPLLQSGPPTQIPQTPNLPSPQPGPQTPNFNPLYKPGPNPMDFNFSPPYDPTNPMTRGGTKSPDFNPIVGR
jgi:hypothetical protein